MHVFNAEKKINGCVELNSDCS